MLVSYSTMKNSGEKQIYACMHALKKAEISTVHKKVKSNSFGSTGKTNKVL